MLRDQQEEKHAKPLSVSVDCIGHSKCNFFASNSAIGCWKPVLFALSSRLCKLCNGRLLTSVLMCVYVSQLFNIHETDKSDAELKIAVRNRSFLPDLWSFADTFLRLRLENIFSKCLTHYKEASQPQKASWNICFKNQQQNSIKTNPDSLDSNLEYILLVHFVQQFCVKFVALMHNLFNNSFWVLRLDFCLFYSLPVFATFY